MNNWADALSNTQPFNVQFPKLGDPCQRCHLYPSTTHWMGAGGFLDYTHGFYQLWCTRCVLEAQLKFALASALRVPRLLLRLAKLRLIP